MDKSSTETTVSSSTNRKLKIAACLFLSTTVIFVSLFIWSEYKGDTNSGNQLTPCSSSPCEHGGNCSVTGYSFTCTCLHGFTGLQCQSTPCDNFSCDNGGTCFLDEFQPKCACKNGVTSEDCTYDSNKRR
ncbi:fibropellin-1-like isoform X1 [Mytilus californianus]|uniref:fibropellin-1-like isoform X1 n=1 Tax=Mytilus californianus TaxID=6549 RepID=UPI002248159A|nr:fibropellin-1-like isoform X1 [Mytilus californianus]XP_052064605.1 fibropellin-1-like isoform X2 [Mytilus californianus]XP_052064612.1 fibropellin-1-like isoform X1 [Mytilus californianus]